MDIYLHIGTNKTGSSAIQTALTRSKAQLLSQGLFVPDSHWDERMLKGLITPGNGHRLALLVSERDKNGLKKYLEDVIRKSAVHAARGIVFSNEVLVRLFSSKNHLDVLSETLESIGGHTVHVLCFWRNIYSHALSLYKHRSKSGCHEDYSRWFTEDYETLRVAKGYVENISSLKWDWHNELYKSGDGTLFDKFFNKFLKVSVPALVDERINTSLNLNELKILQWCEALYPGFHRHLYRRFSMERHWMENEDLKGHFLDAASEFFALHNDIVEDITRILPQEDRHEFVLTSTSYPQHKSVEVRPYITKRHLELISESLKSYNLKNWFGYKYLRMLYAVLFKRKRTRFDRKKFGGSL